jgi:hypothetical protein
MPFSNAKMTKLTTSVTSKGTAALKVSTCLPGLLDVVIEELTKNHTLPPGAQARVAQLRADLVTNAATMQTALGL